MTEEEQDRLDLLYLNDLVKRRDELNKEIEYFEMSFSPQLTLVKNEKDTQ